MGLVVHDVICKTNVPFQALVKAPPKMVHVAHSSRPLCSMPSSRPVCSVPHGSDARDAVLPNDKRHSLLTQNLPKHTVKEGSLRPGQVRVALEVVSEAILLLSLLVWQKVMCEQDASKLAVTP